MNNNKGQMRTVIGYEFTSMVKNKVFIIATVIVAVLLLGVALVPPIFLQGNEGSETPADTDRKVIEIYDEAAVIGETALFASLLPEYEVKFKAGSYDHAEGETAINNGSISGAVVVADSAHYTFYGKNLMISALPGVISAAAGQYNQVTAMQAAGISADEAVALLAAPEITAVEASGKDQSNNYVLTYALIMVLYISIMLYGQMVAVSVATEKSSRAMELLITSAKPNNLIFGKIIGVGLAGISQLLIWVGLAAGSMMINADYWRGIPMVSGVLEAPASLLGLMFLFYILGFFIFATLYGALGSLVSRVEDINASSMPLVLLYMVGFFLAFSGMMDPSGIAVKIGSFIPFFSPMCMFVRVAMSVVPVYEIIISIVLAVAGAILFGWLSSKIYRAGVLMYGKPPSLKELSKVLKNEKKY